VWSPILRPTFRRAYRDINFQDHGAAVCRSCCCLAHQEADDVGGTNGKNNSMSRSAALSGPRSSSGMIPLSSAMPLSQRTTVRPRCLADGEGPRATGKFRLAARTQGNFGTFDLESASIGLPNTGAITPVPTEKRHRRQGSSVRRSPLRGFAAQQRTYREHARSILRILCEEVAASLCEEVPVSLCEEVLMSLRGGHQSGR
jgi:hypothetical protein